MPPLANLRIYHIIHVDRLPSIIADDGLSSDSIMSHRPNLGTTIGMEEIKQRRLALQVDCHPGTYVGNYVPFYFCPRSVMLYLIHRANHVNLSYRGGQEPIIHLEADLNAAVTWANGQGKRWAFSLSNAGAVYAQFRAGIDDLNQINWNSVAALNWREPSVKEGKQAEFLMHESFPWNLISRIGVISPVIAQQAQNALRTAGHKPRVEIRPEWYYQ